MTVASSAAVARRLTEDHRRAQLALAAATTRRLADVFGLWNPDDAVGTLDRWIDAATLVVADAHSSSAALGRAYYRAHRLAAIGSTITGTLPVPAFVADAARTSMIVTGPVSYRRAVRSGFMPDAALRSALVASSRAGSRSALLGGRETITQAVRSDRRARGWSRVTGGDPCDFCELLADRGAVYSAATVDFQAHANCACQPMPAY